MKTETPMSADGDSSRRYGPPLDGDLLLQLIRRPPKPQTARTPPSIPPPTHQNSNIPGSRRPIFSHHSPSPRSVGRSDRSRPRGDGVPSDSQKFSGSRTPKPNARTDGGLDIQRDFDRSHPHNGKGRNPGSRHEALPRSGTVGNGRGKPQDSIQRPVGQNLRRKEADRSAPIGDLQWRQKSTSHGSSNGEVQGTRLVLTPQLDQSRDALGSNLREGFDSKEFIQDSQNEFVEEEIVSVVHKHVKNQVDALADQLSNSLNHKDDNDIVDKKVIKRNDRRAKGHRSDSNRGLQMLSRRIRIHRRGTQCRHDIEFLAPSFLSIYESLIPSVEEKTRQKQLLLSLRKLVSKEWPNAQLHLYGSRANSFGMSNSDIDICLAIEDSDLSKSEILLRLADILQSDNLQNVQALTTARVPIVKMVDPITGISCDICINNLLSVVNTKLLSDYARIDERLRQLAFIVKHWAKSRGVNETYRGTLSSYAYVLMCIHFLQLRNPAILPCLQQMKATYVKTVDDKECAYFDQVEELHRYGVSNNESIAQLLWSFFHYWAYNHDYMNDVISVRTGQLIRKKEKDWTKRIEFDRHLLCIEDPFDTSHDLGRVVDKFTIKILREEFERAAYILQYDPNPSVTLFVPYEPGLSLVDD